MTVHQVDISTPVSLQSCGGRAVVVPPVCLHQDSSCVRQTLVLSAVSCFTCCKMKNGVVNIAMITRIVSYFVEEWVI
jgi:hypothetical protein